MRIAHLIGRVALSIAAAVGVLFAVLLALTYTIEGGYFPGGPMHFPGDDIAPALAVSVLALVVCALLGGLYWIWDDVLSPHVPTRARATIEEGISLAGTYLLIAFPFAGLVGLVVYLASI